MNYVIRTLDILQCLMLLAIVQQYYVVNNRG